ncbi:hypothetical protein C2845_PM04G01400 [Panicum miliaceum]|uniref:F-box domain-containing protein n=1 Tax=Panicum miliaceum TaxID=4540 RepID=A0A3L6QMW8_PANMI|nr:hypothetical protein C2845_PM04G01400 [Panicum miliaceum]
MEDLVEAILLRVQPEDPATLLRAALVCKPWCRLITGAAFRRRFRERHGSPPVLGFFYRSGEATRFTPTTPFRPLCADAAAAGSWCPVDARHGRILFYDTVTFQPFRIRFIVSDPIRGDHWSLLPMPGLLRSCCSWSAAAGCDHLDYGCPGPVAPSAWSWWARTVPRSSRPPASGCNAEPCTFLSYFPSVVSSFSYSRKFGRQHMC